MVRFSATLLFASIGATIVSSRLLAQTEARSAATSVEQPARGAVDSVLHAEAERKQALLTADTVLLSKLTAPEFYEISRLGRVRARSDNMREIATGALKLITVNYDSLSVRVYGDVAILTGIADNTGEFRGIPFAGKIRYTRIFTRRDGRWQA